jgi:hypothetical protein
MYWRGSMATSGQSLWTPASTTFIPPSGEHSLLIAQSINNLHSTVSSLDRLGYDSYLLGRMRMVKLNGNCWHHSYEFWWWSNVVSIRRCSVLLIDCALTDR